MGNYIKDDDESIRDEFKNFLNDTASEVALEKEKIEENTLRNCYVYALCEKEGERLIPFYIGKGSNDRVWNHADETEKEIQEIYKDAEKNKDSQETINNRINGVKAKHKKIQQLTKSGKNKLSKIIIKSGLTEYEAFMCESSLINLLKLKGFNYTEENALTNIDNGHANIFEKESGIDTAAISVRDYYNKYCKKPITINQLTKKQKDDLKGKKILLRNINQTYTECISNKFPDAGKKNEAIREAVRGFWKEGDIKKMDYVFAMYQGRIKGIYKVVKNNQKEFFKILDVYRDDYPRFEELEIRKQDYKISKAIADDLINNKDLQQNKKHPTKDNPYEGLDKSRLFELLSPKTQELCKNEKDAKQKNDKKEQFKFEKPTKKTEKKHYNDILRNWANRKYYVLQDVGPEDSCLLEYINCSVKEYRIENDKRVCVSVFTGILKGKKRGKPAYYKYLDFSK